TQNRSSFFYGKSLFFEKFVLSTIFYSGSIDHQGMLRIFKIFSNKIYTIFKVNFYATFLKSVSDWTLGAVIPGYLLTNEFKIARQGRHAYAPYSNKIYAIC